MTILTYDGSFEGLLSAIFESYALKIKQPTFRNKNNVSQQLFSQIIETEVNEEKYRRVKEKLRAILGKEGLYDLWKATLSEFDDIGDTLYGVIAYVLKENKNILNDYGHSNVLALQVILKKLNRERHRMTAFVRFELANDGIFNATIDPDFDVLPLIAGHFKKRYADQKWLIFDTARNYGIFYDLHQVITVELHPSENDKSPVVMKIGWDESEKEFQTLWQNYFKSTNIASRKNTKLHLQHVPRRYWKYLTEKA